MAAWSADRRFFHFVLAFLNSVRKSCPKKRCLVAEREVGGPDVRACLLALVPARGTYLEGGNAMRRFYPLVIAAFLPLGVCPSTRADYIYTFNGSGGSGPLEASLQ
jgi:hypothetical protein